MRRRLRWILLSIAIAYAGLRPYLLPELDGDFIQTVAAARSVHEGRGITIPSFRLDDLSTVIATPFLITPAGYPLLLSLLMNLSENFQWPLLLLNGVMIVIFFAAWFKIMELLGDALSDRAKLFIWFGWAFSADPLMKMRPAELTAAALFSGALFVSMRMIERDRLSVAMSALSGLLVGLSASVRYMYWPMVAVLPAGFFSLALTRDRRFFKFGLAHLAPAGLILALVVLKNVLACGHPTYNFTYQHGFFPERLASFYPFPVDCLGYFESWRFICDGLGEIFFSAGLWGASIFIAAAVAAGLRPSAPERTEKVFFSHVFLLTLGAILATLINNTLFVHHLNSPVSESRYYAPLAPFVLIFVAQFAFGKAGKPGSQIIKGGLAFVFLCSFFNIYLRPRDLLLREVYYGKGWYRLAETENRGFESILHSVKTAFPIVYLDGPWRGSYRRIVYALRMGIPAAWGDEKGFAISTRSPVCLVFSIPRDENHPRAGYLRRFARETGAVKIGSLENVDVMQTTPSVRLVQ